jgi:hypothetical protein
MRSNTPLTAIDIEIANMDTTVVVVSILLVHAHNCSRPYMDIQLELGIWCIVGSCRCADDRESPFDCGHIDIVYRDICQSDTESDNRNADSNCDVSQSDHVQNRIRHHNDMYPHVTANTTIHIHDTTYTFVHASCMAGSSPHKAIHTAKHYVSIRYANHQITLNLLMLISYTSIH